jgi:hypothetical protein
MKAILLILTVIAASVITLEAAAAGPCGSKNCWPEPEPFQTAGLCWPEPEPSIQTT